MENIFGLKQKSSLYPNKNILLRYNNYNIAAVWLVVSRGIFSFTQFF